MASVRIILRDLSNRKGERPILIRILQNRKQKVITIGSIDPAYWDEGRKRVKKSSIHAQALNEKLSLTVYKLEQRIQDLDKSGRSYSVSDIVDYNASGTLSEAIDRHIIKKKALLQNRSIEKYSQLKGHVLAFGDCLMRDIDLSFMKRFEKFLGERPKIKKRTTIAKYISFLTAVLRSDKGFDDEDVIGYKVSAEQGYIERLTLEEIKTIEEKDLPETLVLSRDAFLVCYYTWGTRISDVLRIKRMAQYPARLTFSESKNKKDNKSVPMIPKLSQIFERYKEMSTWYALPIISLPPADFNDDNRYRKHIEAKTATINKHLKLIAAHCGIDKNISTKTARHTVAALVDEADGSLQEIKGILNHSSVRSTASYLRSLKKTDKLDDLTSKIM